MMIGRVVVLDMAMVTVTCKKLQYGAKLCMLITA